MRNWKLWAKAAAVRAVKTMAQTAVATIGVAAVMQEVNWIAVAVRLCWLGCCLF